METSTTTRAPSSTPLHTRWNPRLVAQIVALLMANIAADSVIVAPLLVLPQMLEHFHTSQAAWISSSAMLAGAMWAPLFGRSADIRGKRTMLIMALAVACVGGVVCLLAPTLWIFVIGRMLQGAAVATVFLSVTIIRDLCVPAVAMPAVGAVTTGGGILGIVANLSIEYLTGKYGFRALFALAALFAVIAVLCIRAVVPDSGVRTPGRVDVAGAVLLGGGLTGVLGYISLGEGMGWFSAGSLLLLGAGIAALVRWFVTARRTADPLIDIRDLKGPLLLTLLVIVLATGATQSMDQLLSLIAQVSPEQQLGYGLDGSGAVSLLFGIPALGIMTGGLASGWLAARTDPSVALAGGVLAGLLGALGMFTGVSSFPAAVTFAVLLNLCLGTLMTTGFNMTAVLTPPERQGVVASMVTVMGAIGSVGMSFVGAAVLSGTSTVVNGVIVNTATGVYSYIGLVAGVLALALVGATALLRWRRTEARWRSRD